LEQYNNLRYYLAILYGNEKEALPTENLKKAYEACKEDFQKDEEFLEKIRKIEKAIGVEFI